MTLETTVESQLSETVTEEDFLNKPSMRNHLTDAYGQDGACRDGRHSRISKQQIRRD